MRSAARDQDPTDHGDVLDGGSGDVFINDRKAWRTDVDKHTCSLRSKGARAYIDWKAFAWKDAKFTSKKADGAEVVIAGIHNIFIDDRRAVGVGHFLMGVASPNMIVAGSPDVFYGDVLTGVAAADRRKEFCRAMKKLREEWPKLTKQQRTLRLSAITRNEARKSGINPPPTLSWQAKTDSLGYWDGQKWQINISPNLMDPKDLKLDLRDQAVPSDAMWCQLSATIVHEVRHAEDSWKGLRYMFAQRPLPKRYYEKFMTDHPVARRNAMRNPMKRSSAEYAEGRLMAEGYYRQDVPNVSYDSRWYARTIGGRWAREIEYGGCCGFDPGADSLREIQA
jgi:hypothetical protein